MKYKCFDVITIEDDSRLCCLYPLVHKGEEYIYVCTMSESNLLGYPGYIMQAHKDMTLSAIDSCEKEIELLNHLKKAIKEQE